MAKITLAPDIESISGRLCRKSAATYDTNKQTGKVHRYDYHAGTQPNSADQQAVKALFKQKAKAATAWWNENKPLKDKQGNVTREATELHKQVIKQYKQQHNIGNPYSYFRSLVDDDLKVTIGTSTVQLTAPDSTTSGGTSGTGTGGQQQGGGNFT